MRWTGKDCTDRPRQWPHSAHDRGSPGRRGCRARTAAIIGESRSGGSRLVAGRPPALWRRARPPDTHLARRQSGLRLDENRSVRFETRLVWHDSRCLSGYSLSTTCLAEQAGRPTGTSVISAGTGPGRATWRPWTVIVPAVASLMAAILLGTLGFFAVGFGMGTMCTDFADTKSTDHCQTLTRWLTAGQVGQGLCAITAVVLLVLAPRRPQKPPDHGRLRRGAPDSYAGGVRLHQLRRLPLLPLNGRQWLGAPIRVQEDSASL